MPAEQEDPDMHGSNLPHFTRVVAEGDPAPGNGLRLGTNIAQAAKISDIALGEPVVLTLDGGERGLVKTTISAEWVAANAPAVGGYFVLFSGSPVFRAAADFEKYYTPA